MSSEHPLATLIPDAEDLLPVAAACFAVDAFDAFAVSGMVVPDTVATATAPELVCATPGATTPPPTGLDVALILVMPGLPITPLEVSATVIVKLAPGFPPVAEALALALALIAPLAPEACNFSAPAVTTTFPKAGKSLPVNVIVSGTFSASKLACPMLISLGLNPCVGSTILSRPSKEFVQTAAVVPERLQ